MRQTLFLVFFLPLSLLQAADWPQFRGPSGDGHAPQADGLVTVWNATKNIVWRKEIPGSGWSSPVVVGGKIFLTAAVPIDKSKDLSLRALCLDARDGKELWSTELFVQEAAKAPKIHGKNSHASPTPLVANGRLYVHFGHQGTACLDLAGKILWKNNELSYAPVHGNGGSPLLVGDVLIFSTDGAKVREILGLDAGTGKIRWRTKRTGSAARNFSFSTPTLIEVEGKRQVLSPGSDVLGAFDPTTGEELWYCKYTGYSVIPKPVIGHGMAFISTGYDRPSVLAIRLGGKGDVTEGNIVWKSDRNAPHTPSMLLVGAELYMVSDNGIASCVDARTGNVHWTKRLPGNGYSSSPIFAGGHLYFLSENGICTVLKAGTTYQEISRNELGERTLASPAVADGALFLRSATHLYRIGK
ncbi:MAG: PQQ-binding-like beta-propeller repeat protein [Gemmataceae bacterium]